MGLLNKLKAIFNVGTREIAENTALSTFNDKVNIEEVSLLLAKAKQDLINYEGEKRFEEKNIEDLKNEILNLTDRLNKGVEFVNDESNSEADRNKVKEDTRKTFERKKEKEVQVQNLLVKVDEMSIRITSVQEKIDGAEEILNKNKNSAKEMISRQKVADSQEKIADSLSQLLSSQGNIESKLSENTKRKEAIAETKLDKILGQTDQKRNEQEIDDLINKKNKEEEFEQLFKK